ncbi:MAG: hypothetical protein IID17_13040, partial [Nitrospinae bacterium]|nr:hypothetical protein [Nitrospinota bacterium]
GQKAQFISIHYMPEAAKEAAEFDIPHWQDAIDDLDEQAALIKACDLVITVNQTLVHTSGALAQKTWVLTPSKPAWRYGLKGRKMAWYPTVTQFRQKKGEDWSGAVGRLSNDLKGFIRSHHARSDRGARTELEGSRAGSGN